MEVLPLNKLLDLTGKTAVVTGAVGIGYGIAYRLAEAGARVVIASRNLAEAEQSVQKLKDRGWMATPLEVDVTREESVKKMVEEAVAVYEGIDILVR
jgi:NAD(P)-dependent dehydrogenase (short-subunit alcohol dehydrogenase family)